LDDENPNPLAMHRLSRLSLYKCRSFVRAAPLASYSTTTKISAKGTSPCRVLNEQSTHARGTDTAPNWDADDSLFTFTRGRFVYDEERQMAQRTVRFSMNELARVAAATIGANRCVDVKKCRDGPYSKVYDFRMDDGRAVIGKVLNPNMACPITRLPARLPPWILFVSHSFPCPQWWTYTRPADAQRSVDANPQGSGLELSRRE
jgi:hypothetical protein